MATERQDTEAPTIACRQVCIPGTHSAVRGSRCSFLWHLTLFSINNLRRSESRKTRRKCLGEWTKSSCAESREGNFVQQLSPVMSRTSCSPAYRRDSAILHPPCESLPTTISDLPALLGSFGTQNSSTRNAIQGGLAPGVWRKATRPAMENRGSMLTNMVEGEGHV